MQDNERSETDTVTDLNRSIQRTTMIRHDRNLRRLALQLAVQLPDDPSQARRVVGYLAELQNEFIDKS